jgi:hypothetical protein
MTVEPYYLMGDVIRVVFRKSHQRYAFAISLDEIVNLKAIVEDMMLDRLERFVNVLDEYERRIHESTEKI